MSLELQLLLLLALIVVISKVAGHVSRVLGQPVVFGEILAGLLFGPTLLNMFHWPIFSPGAADWLHEIVNVLAKIGVLLLMFIAGLETDLDQMRKVGKTAFWSAVMGVVLPLGLGIIVSRAFGLTLTESIFIGAVLTATSVSISAQTLMELNQLASKEGMTILGAAVIDDVLGIIVLSFVVAFGASAAEEGAVVKLPQLLAEKMAAPLGMTHAPEWLGIVLVILLMVLFFAVAIWIARRGFAKMLELASRLHASHAIPAAALLLMLLFSVGAEYLGQVADITGAYLVGVFLARTRFAKEIERGIHPFTYALFVPIFFMSIGLGTDLRGMGGSLLFAGAIIIVAVLTKILGCGLGARLTGFTNIEATRVGMGMISRGEVGLIVAQVGIANRIIGETHYAGLVLMVLATTVVTPVLLRLVFPRAPEVVGVGEPAEEAYESVVALETEEDD